MQNRVALASAMFFVCAGGPALASAEAAKWSLVDARLVKVKDISSEPNAPRLCIDERCTISLDGSWRVKYRIAKTLAGPRITGSIHEDIASAQPKTDLHYLLVLSNDDRRRQIEWRGLYQFGLCLDQDQISRFGLSDAALRFPCRR
jgi:hypothetical protein